MDISSNTGAEAALMSARQNASVTVPKGANTAKLREKAEEFEAQFLSQMLMPMFENIGEGPFGGGQAAQMFKSLQVDEYAKSFVKAGGIGLADSIMQEMLRMQEGQNSPVQQGSVLN
ncbi:MAG: rod-binding protein [Rhodospirillales bacterium]